MRWIANDTGTEFYISLQIFFLIHKFLDDLAFLFFLPTTNLLIQGYVVINIYVWHKTSLLHVCN